MTVFSFLFLGAHNLKFYYFNIYQLDMEILCVFVYNFVLGDIFCSNEFMSMSKKNIMHEHS